MISVDRAAVEFAAMQCEFALVRNDARAAAFWSSLAFDAVHLSCASLTEVVR